MAQYSDSPALVETEWLASNLDERHIRIIEVDEDIRAYYVDHIPNAIVWRWKDDLHDPIRRDFVDTTGLADLLARSGVSDDTTVILYGGNSNWFAAYAYWCLKHQGFDNVKLLNGGRQKWQSESRPMTVERPAVAVASNPPRLAGPRAQIRALRDEVLSVDGGDHTVLIDVRSPEEFCGDLLAPPHLPQEQAQVPGHIPGAKNIPWSKATDEDGTFKSPAELKKLYGSVGADADKQIIAYCRIGERSSHTWFVLHELLGYGNVKNYDGSWTEYGSLVGVPVER